MKPLLLVALLGCLASVFVAPTITTVKWCVISDAELRKCSDLYRHNRVFSCVRRDSTRDCMLAIKAGEADAVTLNGGDIYIAGLRNTDLAPIIAENYPPRRGATHENVHQKRPYYSVAVVKKNSKFRIRDLKGKRSCHTGLGDPEGWVTPMGALVSLGLIQWPSVENKPLEQAVSEFFYACCVPGGTSRRDLYNLCTLCKGDCSKSVRELFYGNAGAFKCLEEDGGEVAFVRHDAVPESEKVWYELLCKDNSRAPVDSYEFCNLGKAGEEDFIVSVDHGSSSCDYAVAVVKKGTTFGFNDLRGKRSCHTGLGAAEGWHLPIGTLLATGLLTWLGPEEKPLEEAVTEFFQSSCIPGARGNLCHLCKGDCSKSDREPYYGDDGAFRCLAEGAGEVAFTKLSTVPDSEKANYELLCKDNTRAPLENFKSCNLGRVPTHAVVSRKDPELAEFIWTNLNAVQGFNLFSSENYAPSKNLMFTDSTTGLVRVPPGTDSFLYLSPEYMKIVRSLERREIRTVENIKWCVVGHAETVKCDTWSINSINHNDETVIECHVANTVEECLKMIMRKEADAMAVDGGQVYTAGKCGLVPVMAEQYDEAMCATSGVSSYYAVAVVKKNSGVNWNNLRGKRSCHSAIGRSAGWNIPMGYIYAMTKDCDFTKFFSEGCAPGADPTSPFCVQCAGSGRIIGDAVKCKPNSDEKYYGDAGAFRCLVEDAGDVAFIRHTTVSENTDGAGPSWAQGLNSADFELICPGGFPAPITNFASCNLARLPGDAVMSLPENRAKVVRILQDQQVKFGPNGSDDMFRMFQSESGKNLLFTDSTKCLQEVQGDNYASFLGDAYMTAMRSLRECRGSTPDLENSCTFQSCQETN